MWDQIYVSSSRVAYALLSDEDVSLVFSRAMRQRHQLSVRPQHIGAKSHSRPPQDFSLPEAEAAGPLRQPRLLLCPSTAGTKGNGVRFVAYMPLLELLPSMT